MQSLEDLFKEREAERETETLMSHGEKETSRFYATELSRAKQRRSVVDLQVLSLRVG